MRFQIETERPEQPDCDCLVCERIRSIKKGENPYFVRELKTGYVVIGDHQRFEGYSLFLCKEHATELHHLAPETRQEFLREMSIAAEAVQCAFRADKMNYELLGAGRGRHMHWHLFPRRAGDTERPGPVWQTADMNDEQYLPSPDQLEKLKNKLNHELERLISTK